MTEPDTQAVAADHTYEVRARTTGASTSEIHTKQRVVTFDSSPRQGGGLPGPADLLTSAFAACIIKNV